MSTTASASPADTFISEPVRTPYSLDAGPGRYRIGLVVLASDYVTERDFINMRPSDEVTIHTSRVRNVNPVTVENLRKMAPLITESASLIIPDGRLDSMAYSCTSGTVVIGYEAVRASIQAARPGIPVATPISASLAAFERLGVRRVAVLTPYVDDVNRAIAAHLHQHGVEVPRFTSFHIADDNHMAGLSPEVIHRAALEADSADAEALFISCTAIRAVEAVERIETDLGKPVVTAIQAMFWQALRFAGCQAPVAGYGRLLRLPA